MRTQKPDTRGPVFIYLDGSLKSAIDKHRNALGQSRSEWIARAAKAFLKAAKEKQ